MRSKALRIALLIYLFLWFGVIVPGHKRGVVTFDGKKPVASDCCCCCGDTPAPAAKGTDSSQTPTKPSQCAICDFAAHLTLPPPIDLTLSPLCRLKRAPAPSVERLIPLILRMSYNGRAPPTA